MDDLSSVSPKKVDTRNNWVTMMFVTKCRYNCFRKQSHIDTCIAAFKELETLGFEFGEMGFGGTHVHFLVNIPKKYSVTDAEVILKSRSAMRIFAEHPGFRKRYPRGSFWSGYEHHQSTGMQSIFESTKYIKEQQEHHNIKIIDDTQTRLTAY
jgi:REP element-mobilizing transposase RayT